MYMHNNHCHRVTAHLQLNILLLLICFERNFCSLPPCTEKMYTSSHVWSIKHQITVRVIGQYRIVGPQYETGLMSSFWCLEFGGTVYVFGNLLHHYSNSQKYSNLCTQ